MNTTELRHWNGTLTSGEVPAVRLLFVVSQEDHCLNHVQPWIALHHGTLSALLDKTVLPSHAHDDRLADCLTRLGSDDAFNAVERDFKMFDRILIVSTWDELPATV